tara:strand:+ start:3096 stop:3248 length:153 start_codon:yes stop_codon:yes gene_type:complete
MKHPTQGFIKELKESASDIIEQLETQGWYKCQDRKDSTPYKQPSKKTKKK